MNYKKNFYIFLDIEGVMWDWDYIKKSMRPDALFAPTYKPESVDALNFLIKKLEKQYNVIITISSSWKYDLDLLKMNFKRFNVICKNLDKTGSVYDSKHRGKKILQYLNDKKENQNYVVIDDDDFDFQQCIPQQKIIKTEIFHNSLNLNQVKTFLNKLSKEKSFVD